MEIRNIVVPLDGSLLAERALPLASMIARRAHARMRVVAVVPGAGFVGPFDAPDLISQALYDARARLREYVDRIVARLGAEPGVRVSGHVRVDTPVEGILKTAVEEDADLIVLTSHGRGGFKRAFLGSVTDALLRRAAVPVLVVKPVDDVPADQAEPRFDSVVIPLDGSITAEGALDAGYAMARLLEVTPVLLQVLPPEVVNAPVPPVEAAAAAAATQESEEYLRSVAVRPEAADVRPRAVVLHDDSDAGAIVGFCAGSLAVIASHGRGGLKRLLLGSVADKVVRMSDYPVLFLRPRVNAGGIEAIWRANADPAASDVGAMAT